MDEVIQFEPLNNSIICHGISIRHYQSAGRKTNTSCAHQGHELSEKFDSFIRLTCPQSPVTAGALHVCLCWLLMMNAFSRSWGKSIEACLVVYFERLVCSFNLSGVEALSIFPSWIFTVMLNRYSVELYSSTISINSHPHSLSHTQ